MQINKPSVLPSPGAHLNIVMECGEHIEGVRPEYIQSATGDDPGYRDRCGNRINAESMTGWFYQAWKKVSGDKVSGAVSSIKPGHHIPPKYKG